MIPDEVVDRVRNETDIVSLIGEFVKLKRVGNSYRGPCPFHHGKNPNFSVTDRGYNCFKCGESGDVFTFVQKHLGMSFVEAVKLVGEKSGIEVREVARHVEQADPREPIWELNAHAAEFFQAELWDAPEGRVARDYLASRGFSRDDAERFSIGYAPRDSATMRGALRALGFDDERLKAAGLLREKQDKPDELSARFRGRLMIPIHDASARIVGFGGRILGVGEPKYLNSADSPVFSKRQLLYGMHRAKHAARKADRLVIVEGYFDAMRLMLAGIEEVVAPMGTALTEEQAAQIRKYTANVFLLYDSDQAGLKATFKSGDELLARGASPRVITLPDGEDPDTFFAKEGAEGFERAAGEAVDVFERKIQILERGGWFADLHRKRQALDKLLPTIRVTADAFLKDLYIARTVEASGVRRETILDELQGQPRERRRPRVATEIRPHDDGAPPFDDDVAEARPPVRRKERRADRQSSAVRAERELVRMLLHQRRYLDGAAERIGPDMFADPVYRDIFSVLTAHEHDASVEAIAADLDEEATVVLQELLAEQGGLDRAEESVRGSINAMLAREIADRLSEIDRLLPVADGSAEDELILEKKKLLAEMQTFGRQRWKNFVPKRS